MIRPGRAAIHLVTSGADDEGRGHVARTLSLAEAFVAAGTIPTVEMLRGAPTAGQAAELARLGAATVDSGTGAGADAGAVVVDLPDPNAVADRWPPDRLVVFDDRQLLRGRAGLIVQPSLPAWGGGASAGRVLAGYRYAPIRAALRRLAADPPPPADPAEVVVCFGGSDPADVAARLVPAVAAGAGWAARTVPIVGPAYRGTLEPAPSWDVVRDPADLDERLARATVALIGGGTMKVELALLGIPAVIVAVADDQLPVAPPFAATGAARFAGDGRTADPSAVARAVSDLLADGAERVAMSRAARSLIDGLGAQRVAAAVLALAAGR